MTLLTQPRFPAGSSYAVARPRRGVTFDPAAATPYDRLPRTLNWAWWRPLVGLVVFGVLALVGSMAVVFGALLLLVAQGQVDPSPEGLLEWQDTLLQIDASDPMVLALSLGSIAIWLPAVAGGLWAAGLRPLAHVSSVALRLRWRWMLRCAVVALATLALSFALSFGLGALTGETGSPVWTPWQQLLLPMILILLLVPFQAAAEEYVFRGLLVQALGSWLPRRVWSRIIVVIVPTLAFVFSHGYGVWGQLDVGVFALAAMWVTLRTGGLEAAIALHVINNVVVFTMLASGALGSTVNGAEGGSLAGVLITAITSIGFCWVVDVLARRGGIERTSSWPEREAAAPLPIALPHPGIGWLGPAPTPQAALAGALPGGPGDETKSR